MTAPYKGAYGMGLRGRLLGDGWHVAAEVSGKDVNNGGEDNDSLTWSMRAHWSPRLGEAREGHLAVWGFHETIAGDPAGTSRNVYIGGHFSDNLLVLSGVIATPDKGHGSGAAEQGRRVVQAAGC